MLEIKLRTLVHVSQVTTSSWFCLKFLVVQKKERLQMISVMRLNWAVTHDHVKLHVLTLPGVISLLTFPTLQLWAYLVGAGKLLVDN